MSTTDTIDTLPLHEHLAAMVAEYPDLQIPEAVLRRLDGNTAVTLPLSDGSDLHIMYSRHGDGGKRPYMYPTPAEVEKYGSGTKKPL